jgi:hypothetical protein
MCAYLSHYKGSIAVDLQMYVYIEEEHDWAGLKWSISSLPSSIIVGQADSQSNSNMHDLWTVSTSNLFIYFSLSKISLREWSKRNRSKNKWRVVGEIVLVSWAVLVDWVVAVVNALVITVDWMRLVISKIKIKRSIIPMQEEIRKVISRWASDRSIIILSVYRQASYSRPCPAI